MTLQNFKAKLIGSPLVLAQLSVFIYMSVYGVVVTFKAFDN